MPIRSPLSRKAYDRLGDEVARELVEWYDTMDATYRADLRELNEINFARFDAKLEQRFAQFDAKLEQRFAQFEAHMFGDLGNMRSELGNMRGELGNMRGELGNLRAELIKWSFVFFATAALAVIGLR